MEKPQSLNVYKVIRKLDSIESFNDNDKTIHSIDLSFVKVNIFYNAWIGYRSDNQMREILEGHFLNLYSEHKCTNLLSDCSKMQGSFIDISGWFAETFIPLLAELGLKNHSIVLPLDVPARLSVDDFINKTPQVKTIAFISLSDALNWLAMA